MIYSETMSQYEAVLEIYLQKGKRIFYLQRALPLENLKVNGKLLKGHQGQDQGAREAMACVAFMSFQVWYCVWQFRARDTLGLKGVQPVSLMVVTICSYLVANGR